MLSLTGIFAVPKGPTDVQLVYDASASGLNGVLWAPTFALPGAHALLDIVTPSSWMGDLDMGDPPLQTTTILWHRCSPILWLSSRSNSMA